MEVPYFIFFAYLIVVNAVSLFIMGSDKLSSRTAQSGRDRVSEGLFFFLGIIGGSFGVYAGMFIFRHKTQKLYFILGLPILIVQQILLAITFFLPFLDT